MADRHGPNRLSNYIQVHETVMDQFRAEGVVEYETLEFIQGAGGYILLDGEIVLRDGILKISVTKGLEVTDNGTDDPTVQTRSYSYNVCIVGESNVFRYCSPHDDPGPEHHLYHHCHRYDPFGPDVHVSRVEIRRDGDWPLLGEVIREADCWYWANKDALEKLIGNG